MIKLLKSNTVQIATGTIVASDSYTSDAYDVTSLDGFFSLQWTVTGDGTLTIEVLVSNDGEVFNDIDADITTGQLKTSGISGTNMAAIDPTTCNFIKLKFTETSTTDSISVTARLKGM